MTEKTTMEDLYSFTYSDGLREGIYITEHLLVDKLAGRFTWSRGIEGEALSLRQGSSFLISQVSSVRFSTRLGDPSSEHLTATQKQVAVKRTVETWLKNHAPSILSILVMIFNVLTLTVALAGLLTYISWQVFPVREDRSSYDMAQGPDSEVLVAAALVAALTAVAALLSGWWLGTFQCGGCGLQRNTLGIGSRLSDNVAMRLKVQRPLTGGTLAALIAWCLFIILLSPISYGLSRRTECLSGGCNPLPNSTLVPTCGVGSCSCGAVADLSCVTAQDGADLSICRNVKQPLCSATGSADTTSGVHVPLLVMAVGTSALTCFLFLIWLLNLWCMYSAWIRHRDTESVVMVQEKQYHRFSVNFRSRADGKLIFTMSAEEDPHAIAAALMPTGLRGFRGGGTPNYQAPSMMMGGYVPGVDGFDGGASSTFDHEGDNAELEPVWC